ncbi:winged helix-turn-helix transcriptional regulator [Aeromicrobium duanguangcaii]|uniref:Helix-turn-helix transcriptional regulator n=1 Tax=Aeromicrobium duanguangcaii TaxID=2968086 RepID=A0ABY5KFD5_9ACTN|nr:helix-turn-helix domain-containing protein [Aeromicrobium duanguangcaii]MCD9153886.1 helix-turn-helix transcriptional regulator [Aeromicrobium duanguangcaii]MCL3837611.1 helix-turn-helix transcriptional regulator [Aeromicrobium duanguangcaii]UUI69035.1 helix-turn-helix transcriptional regulator [Aeromicrobium duanguangcaii]
MSIRGYSSDEPTGPSTPNALSRGFGVLGDEWTLFLLRFALQGCRRYTEFSTRMPISHAVLSGRLEALVRSGLMVRHEYQQRPPRNEYVLTDSGRATWPILAAIWGWERTWVHEHSYETPPMRHITCGQETTPVLTCRECHRPVTVRDLDTSWGPAGGWRSSVPETATRRRSSTRGTAVGHTFYPDTMAIFGNRWSWSLMGAALLGVRRFSEFEAALGLPPSLLSGRLSTLREHGIIEQVTADSSTERSEYRLTDKGLAFFPVIAMTIGWAERWFAVDEGPALVQKHRACGADFVGELTCDRCGEPLRGTSLDMSELDPPS